MLIIVLVVIILAIAILAIIHHYCYLQPSHMFCIMTTGKDPCRQSMAQQSLFNFLQQDYKGEKTLVILNQSTTSVINASTAESNSHIFEYFIDKEANNLTLGDVRNIGLAMVAPNSIWTTWDDDDYRATNYLTTMTRRMSNADVLVFTDRLEYNANNGHVWQIRLKTGFPVVFAKQDMRILYKQKDTMEDTQLITDFLALGKSVRIYDNHSDPQLYVRMIHSNNTSNYVNRFKTGATKQHEHNTYQEYPIDAKLEQSVSSFMSTYFKTGIQCHKSIS